MKVRACDTRVMLPEVYCTPGIKRWCEQNNLDFRTFVREGYEEDVLLATGDSFAIRFIAKLRETRNG